jgi:hypothetical protein
MKKKIRKNNDWRAIPHYALLRERVYVSRNRKTQGVGSICIFWNGSKAENKINIKISNRLYTIRVPAATVQEWAERRARYGRITRHKEYHWDIKLARGRR